MGFYYSHYGYWKNFEFYGETTSLECANACKQGCFAIDTDATTSIVNDCFHYYSKEDLVEADKILNGNGEHFKAYIKCWGIYELGFYYKLDILQ